MTRVTSVTRLLRPGPRSRGRRLRRTGGQGLTPARPETLDQCLHDQAPVREGGELRPSEERRCPIRVDGDHGARALDAGHMLTRARDAEREVELGCHGTTALADLPFPRDPSEVDRHAAAADRGVQKIGQHLEPAKALRSHAPTACDDALRIAQVDRARVRRDDAADRHRGRGAVGRRGPLLDRDLRSAGGRAGADGSGPERHDRGGAGGDAHGRVQPIPVRRTRDLDPGVALPANGHRVGRERRVEADGELRGDTEPVAGVREQHDRRWITGGGEPRRHRAARLGRRRGSGRAEPAPAGPRRVGPGARARLQSRGDPPPPRPALRVAPARPPLRPPRWSARRPPPRPPPRPASAAGFLASRAPPPELRGNQGRTGQSRRATRVPSRMAWWTPRGATQSPTA